MRKAITVKIIVKSYDNRITLLNFIGKFKFGFIWEKREREYTQVLS